MGIGQPTERTGQQHGAAAVRLKKIKNSILNSFVLGVLFFLLLRCLHPSSSSDEDRESGAGNFSAVCAVSQPNADKFSLTSRGVGVIRMERMLVV